MLNLKVHILVANNSSILRQVKKETSRFYYVIVYLVKTIPKATQEGHQAALLLMVINQSRICFMIKFTLFQPYKKLFPKVETIDKWKQSLFINAMCNCCSIDMIEPQD